MRRSIIFILTGFFMLSISGMALAQEDDKVGFVDLSRAFDEYQKTKDFDRDLEKKGDIKQEQREKLVREIRKMRDEVELMNEKARAKKEKDIEADIKSLQEFDQGAKTSLTKDRDDMVRDILKEMSDIIQEYGDKNGYSIILNDRVLLFGSKQLDLTDEIIKILNNNYKR
ncbi:OmpH family outer membrane protein [Candidatus Omnitrophota bacterium]